jgi:hypothetical protein
MITRIGKTALVAWVSIVLLAIALARAEPAWQMGQARTRITPDELS